MRKHSRQGRIRKDSASSHSRKRLKPRATKKKTGKPDKRKTKKLLQNKRSIAAKKGHRTRKLKFKGIDLAKRWEGKDKLGNPTGYVYERYNLPILDAGTVKNIISHVKKKNKGKPFLVGGQADFRDKDDRLFTNNAELKLDNDPKAPAAIVSSLHRTIQQPSNPFQVGRSSKIDVEDIFVLIRFKRERFHEPKKYKPKAKPKHKPKAKPKRKPVKRKPVKRKRK